MDRDLARERKDDIIAKRRRTRVESKINYSLLAFVFSPLATFMIITWYGHSCFKIQSGDLVVITDPFAKEIGLTPPRVRSDIVTVTHDHFDHANTETLAGEPFVITGPGEYEVKGVYIHGVETFHDSEQGAKRGLNTIYTINTEDITVAHMGDFGEDMIRPETADELGSIDILMIPVGGTYTIDAKAAAKIVKQLEPRFVIPMHYALKGLSFKLDGLDAFLKEMGAGTVEPVEKFSIKKKDIGTEEKTEVVTNCDHLVQPDRGHTPPAAARVGPADSSPHAHPC